jgi:hypothetical protein
MNTQLSTLVQALLLVQELNDRKIGGGIKPVVYMDTERSLIDHSKSGIYDQNYDWVYGIGSPPTDLTDPKARSYCLRFKSGVEGNNVGLILDRLKRFPTSPEYVYRSLDEEVVAAQPRT